MPEMYKEETAMTDHTDNNEPCPFCPARLSPFPKDHLPPDLHGEANQWFQITHNAGCYFTVLGFGDYPIHEDRLAVWNSRVSVAGAAPIVRNLYSRLVQLAATVIAGHDFISPDADDNPKSTPRAILDQAEKQKERLRVWAIEIREVADALITTTAATAAPVEQSEHVASSSLPAEQLAQPWRDEGGHTWEIRQGVTCVECPHCCFVFAAEHTDGYSSGYSCPNCQGCPDAAPAEPEGEQEEQ